MSAKTMKGPYLDVEGHKTGRSYANHSYEIRSDKESLALMNFLDKNTSVEWANTLIKTLKTILSICCQLAIMRLLLKVEVIK